IVRIEALLAHLYKGKPAQPLEQLVPVRHPNQLSEQRLGGDADQCARLERGAVAWARRLLDELLKQRLDNIERSLWLEMALRVLRQAIGYQRQGERVAMGELQDRLALAVGHVAHRQQVAALGRAEVAQWYHAQHRAPARV